MTGQSIRSKRMAAGISGHAVCQLTSITRSLLSEIERQYNIASAEEL